MHEVFKFDVVPPVYFCFYCLCFCGLIWEIIVKSNVMKASLYIFYEFYNFRSSLFWVNFCIWFKFQVRIQLCPFACGYPVFPIPFVEEIVLSLLSGLDSHVGDYLTIYVRAYFWALCSTPLIYLPSLMPAPHCIDHCVGFEIRACESSNLTFLFQNCFSLFSYFEILYEF